jgi:hypothetical protein
MRFGRILEEYGGFFSLRIGTSGGSCDHGNENLVSIKGGEFLD